MNKKASPDSVSKLVLLFPCTYLVHIIEEFWCGERFFNWLNRVTQAKMTEYSFLLLNGIFLLVMILATFIAIWRRDHRILLVLASIVSVNALLHIFGSIVTKSYSPGLVSALGLWLPLAVRTFYHESRFVSARDRFKAVAIGICVHAIVSLLALG